MNTSKKRIMNKLWAGSKTQKHRNYTKSKGSEFVTDRSPRNTLKIFYKPPKNTKHQKKPKKENKPAPVALTTTKPSELITKPSDDKESEGEEALLIVSGINCSQIFGLTAFVLLKPLSFFNSKFLLFSSFN